MIGDRLKWLGFGIVLFVLGANGASAQPSTQCPQHFADGTTPIFANARLAERTRPLCYAAFAVLHSGVTRTPLWAAQHLTRASVGEAACIDRVNAFHAEKNLPQDERAVLADYVGSGFDRGHLAPAADMPSQKAQDESFSLANMVPQVPDLNRKLWERIEATTQRLAVRQGDLYVVTGAVFQGEDLQALRGRVLVPTHMYKAIYSPTQNQAGAYYVTNTKTTRFERLSLDELRQRTGVDAFPGLSAAVKAQALALPQPRTGGRLRCDE